MEALLKMKTETEAQLQGISVQIDSKESRLKAVELELQEAHIACDAAQQKLRERMQELQNVQVVHCSVALLCFTAAYQMSATGSVGQFASERGQHKLRTPAGGPAAASN